MGYSDEAASAALSSSAAPRAQALPAQQNITVTNRQLNITPFTIDRDPTNTANRWDKWKKDTCIECLFCFSAFMARRQFKKDVVIMADLEGSLPDVENTGPPADSVICGKQKTNHSPTTLLGYEKSPSNANITMRTAPSKTT